MRLHLIDAPQVEPLTLDEIRARLNIGDDVLDEVLESLVASSRQSLDGVDGYLGRALITQTWQGYLECFPSYEIPIPLPPLQSINSITYIDASTGNLVTLDDTDYQVVLEQRSFIFPSYGKSWPSVRIQPSAVNIEFVAGYGDSGDDVPGPIRDAIALLVSQMRSLSSRDQNLMIDNVIGVGSKTYATGRDGGTDPLTIAVMSLLSNYRVIS